MRKKIVIIGILLMLFVFGVTYAWWSWNSSTNTDVTFNVEGASITYSAGNNISGIKLIPVSSKEKGVSDNTAAYKEITASSNKTMYLTLNLDLTTFPSQLADASLVWEIYKGNTKIGNGNFSGKQQGNSITLFKDQEINSTESLYKLYIWIDGNQTNPNTMMNQDFVFTLNATATDEVVIPDRLMVQPIYNIPWCESGDNTFDECYGEEYHYSKDGNILGKVFEEPHIISRIITVANKNVPANAVDSWDVSESQNGSVMAWFIDSNAYCKIIEYVGGSPRNIGYYDKEYCDANVSNYNNYYYDDNKEYIATILDLPVYELYIGQDGGVVANPNSSFLFSEFVDLVELDLSHLNTDNVTDMSYMFAGLFGLQTLNLGNNFNTSNVTNMRAMFSGITNMTTLNLGSNFDTSKVEDMSFMFYAMLNLLTLDLNNKFNTSNVTNMSYMFYRMHSLSSLNLGRSFDTSKVEDMPWMFTDDSLLEVIYTALDFNINSLNGSDVIFFNCNSLVGGNNTTFNRNNDDVSYAKIDRPGTPGYFTDIAVLNS